MWKDRRNSTINIPWDRSHGILLQKDCRTGIKLWSLAECLQFHLQLLLNQWFLLQPLYYSYYQCCWKETKKQKDDKWRLVSTINFYMSTMIAKIQYCLKISYHPLAKRDSHLKRRELFFSRRVIWQMKLDTCEEFGCLARDLNLAGVFSVTVPFCVQTTASLNILKHWKELSIFLKLLCWLEIKRCGTQWLSLSYTWKFNVNASEIAISKRASALQMKPSNFL